MTTASSVRVGEHLLERAVDARVRVAARELLPARVRGVADPGELGEHVDVAHQVRAPGAESDLGDPHGRVQSFHTFPATSWPLVALRKSTTICARATSSP